MDPQAAPTRRVGTTAYAVAVAGLAAGAALLFAPAFARPMEPVVGLAWLVGLAAGWHLVQSFPILSPWTGARVVWSLEETLVLLSLLLAPPLVVPFAAGLGRLTYGVHRRRPALKSAFNVGQAMLAVMAALATQAALRTLAGGTWIPALAGLVAFSLVNEGLFAGLLALLESASPLRAYRKHLARAHAQSLLAGATLGLVGYGLWLVHPLALAACVPLVLLTQKVHGRATEAERELATWRRLESQSSEFLGCADEEKIARIMAGTAADCLAASRVEVRVGARALWTETTARRQGPETLRCPLVGWKGEALGALEAWSAHGQGRFREHDEILLRVIANEGGHAIANARAMKELAAQRDVIARQEKVTAMGTIVAGVAHEINSPLLYVGGNLDLAIEDLKARAAGEPIDLAATAQSLETARRGVDAIARLSQTMRALLRKEGAPRASVDLAEMLDEVREEFSRAAPRGVTIQASLPDRGALVVRGSRPELRGAVASLVRNAFEAVEPAGGVVRLELEARGARAVVRVRDSGPGIPSHLRSRLFTPFFTTKSPTGKGLSLVLAQAVAREHGGELSFRAPEGEAWRTEFALELPA